MSAIIIPIITIIVITVVFTTIKSNRVKASDDKTVLSSEIKEKLKYIFAESSEEYISSIGNGYIVNYLLNKSLSKGVAIVSNKRVYFKGKCYYQNAKGKLKKQFTEEIVDLKDVTGTGYRRVSPTYLLWAALGVFVFAILTIAISSQLEADVISVFGGLLLILGPGILLIFYILGCVNTFEISFAGGRIAFDTHLYAKIEIDDFQKQLRRAKDNITGSGSVQTVTVNTAKIGLADEIKKYSELLQQGAITQEEYEQLKKDIIASATK